MGIPDSGNYAALGYATAIGIPFEIGMIRNHYIGRTFIQPTQFLREFRVRVKLNPIRDMLKRQACDCRRGFHCARDNHPQSY
jgi:amidophosphoribosyltransferase